MTVLEIIKDGSNAHFIELKNKEMWYKVKDFKFPIPLEKTEGGVFLAVDKASIFKRWIRKHLDLINQSLENT
jgi:hypothetical protein